MVLFRARDLDAPAKKRARCFDWQRPGIREAYELSVVSLVASGVAVIMGAVSTGQTDSATALGYTLENCVDFLGSVLVLWRFSGGGDGVPSRKRFLRRSVIVPLSAVSGRRRSRRNKARVE